MRPGISTPSAPSTLLTLNPFVRQDRVHYYASADSTVDTPATLSQDRGLTNWGFRGDVSYGNAHHNLKIGGQLMQTRLHEDFTLGITDSTFNPVCLDSSGDPQDLPTVTNPAQCAGLGFVANPDFNPDLQLLDLTRGGSPFQFTGAENINEYAGYIQDVISFGGLVLTPGLRVDKYSGAGIEDTQAEPRIGVSYHIRGTGTILRAGYARTMETPYNENLLVATSPDSAALVAAFSEEGGAPVATGHRNQYNIGIQQALGRYVLRRCRLLLEVYGQRL